MGSFFLALQVTKHIILSGQFEEILKGRKMKKLLTILLFACLFLPSCATNETGQIGKSNLTAGMVKKTIIEGVTTQNEILKVFGAPNIITKNKSGNEVWTYDTVSVVKSGEEGYWNVVVGGVSGGKSSASTRTFTLMIEFGNDDVVKECSYRTSAF